jgi:hypothetical protein
VPERVSPDIAADPGSDPGFALPAGSNQCIKGLRSYRPRDGWLDKLLTRSVSNVGIFGGTLLQKDGK